MARDKGLDVARMISLLIILATALVWSFVALGIVEFFLKLAKGCGIYYCPDNYFTFSTYLTETLIFWLVTTPLFGFAGVLVADYMHQSRLRGFLVGSLIWVIITGIVLLSGFEGWKDYQIMLYREQ